MNKHAKRGEALALAVVAVVSFLAQPALADSSLATGAGPLGFHNPYGTGGDASDNTDWMSEDFLPSRAILGAMANVGPWAIGAYQGLGAAAWTLSVQLVDDASDGLPFYGPYNDNDTPANLQDDTGQADVYLPVPVVDDAIFSTGNGVVPAAFTQPALVNDGVNVAVAQTAPRFCWPGLFHDQLPTPHGCSSAAHHITINDLPRCLASHTSVTRDPPC